MAETVTYPLGDAHPAPGALMAVAPGVHWLRMPLPFALDHINLWVLDEADGGVTLVDTGVCNDATKAQWERLFAGPLRDRRVHRVIATHFHPDHMGLAGWLCPRFGVDLWATLGEWTFGAMLCYDRSEAFTENQVAFYARHGMSPEGLEIARKRGNPYASRVAPIPPAVRRITDGETLDIGGRAWRVIVGRGHAPEHASLYCPELDLLISGDQVLPRISPNVSVWPQEPEADPLPLFLDSLTALKAATTPDTLALPSHGRPFHGLPARADELAAHHADRLDDALAACAEAPLSAAELTPVLFHRQLDDHQMFFAIGESLAHLHALRGQGRLVSVLGDDGVVRFRRP